IRPSRMIGKLHMTTLFGPRESAGSSFATVGSGVGENQPACTGWPGSETSIACSPPECQESKIRSRSTVGLCEEYEVNCSVSGSSPGLPWKAGLFWKILYSPTMRGARGCATFQRRAQPHGHPNDGTVNVPYTSSIVSANGRPGSGTAEWLSAQPAAVWPSQCGPVPQVGKGTGVSSLSLRLTKWSSVSATTSLVSRTPNPPRRYARYVRVPSNDGVIEWSE